jgi:pimeloyl-ACP methyl ester carboxylesterase
MSVARLPAPELPERIGRLLPFRRSLVALEVARETLRVHVMEAGPEDPRAPTVVLLHGNPTWGFLWRKVAAALDGAGLRIVVPDLAGLGLSDKPRWAGFHTLERHARVVGALLDALVAGPIVLALHDWGAPIGLVAMAGRLERLAGLVLTNTGVAPPRPGRRPTAFHRFANLPLVSDVAFRLLGFPQNALAFSQAERASISGDVAFAYRWPLRALADRAAPLALARMVPVRQDHPSVSGLRIAHSVVTGFRGPAAIVWGDRDPILGRALRGVAEALPGATVVRVPAGHFLQEEAPVPIADAIREVARRAKLA